MRHLLITHKRRQIMNQNQKYYLNSLLFIPIATELTALDGNVYTAATFWFIIATWYYLKIERDKIKGG